MTIGELSGTIADRTNNPKCSRVPPLRDSEAVMLVLDHNIIINQSLSIFVLDI